MWDWKRVFNSFERISARDLHHTNLLDIIISITYQYNLLIIFEIIPDQFNYFAIRTYCLICGEIIDKFLLPLLYMQRRWKCVCNNLWRDSTLLLPNWGLITCYGQWYSIRIRDKWFFISKLAIYWFQLDVDSTRRRYVPFCHRNHQFIQGVIQWFNHFKKYTDQSNTSLLWLNIAGLFSVVLLEGTSVRQKVMNKRPFDGQHY